MGQFEREGVSIGPGAEGLGALKVERKSGREPLHDNGRQLKPYLKDFWQWYASDLAGNSLRGVFAEFLVASAMGLANGTRLEWDACDLRTEGGLRIEVKSAAYIQTWSQENYSPIRFDIKPTQGWDAATNTYYPTPCRNSDIYVFCLLKHKGQETLDPLDTSQWEFYVLPTSTLDEHIPKQKSIGLAPLKRLDPARAEYTDLRNVIEELA